MSTLLNIGVKAKEVLKDFKEILIVSKRKKRRNEKKKVEENQST